MRLVQAIQGKLAERETRYRLAAGRLDALSPLGTLRRGYAVPLSDDGTVLRHGDMFTIGGRFALRVIDAHVDCRVEGISNAKAGGGES